MRVTELYLYPLKSARGIAMPALEIGERGPQWDRRWMLVDGEGNFLTQRQLPQMTQIVPALADGEVMFSAPGMPDLVVPFFYWDMIKVSRPVKVWRDTVAAKLAEDHVNQWFSQVIGRDCRLAFMPEKSRRKVDPAYARRGEITGFSDGFPLLLTTQASLQQFNAWMGETVEMSRFRPNLVVDGEEAFAEDGWKRIRVGEMEFSLVKPCSRCAIPTLDPLTGERNPAVFATLKEHRSRDGEVFFGQNLLARGRGRIRVGDVVEVLA